MAIYHVDYITGSNTNTGGPTDPYATIKYAIDTNATGAGDTIKVAGSGLTSRDAAATIVVGGAYNTLNTSIDLTTFIAVGDIVVVNPPNVTDYNGWTTRYVTAITATTITFQEGLYLPGTARVGNWEIFTIDEIIGSTASTFETLTSSAGADTVVEGGYNSTFTAIVGRTYFRRTGLSAGSRTGNCFSYTNGPGQANIIFKNFGFLQWNQAFNLGFGSSYRADNLLFMYSQTGIGDDKAMFPADPGTPANLYFVDCNTATQGFFYYIETIANHGYGQNFNVYTYVRSQAINTGQKINKLVIWHSYQGDCGAQFGASALIKNVKTGTTLNNCDLTWNVVDHNDPDGTPVSYFKSSVIFGTEDNQINQILGNINSITKIDGGVTTYYYNWFNNRGTNSWKTSCIKMPTGYSLLNEIDYIAAANGDKNRGCVGSNSNLIDDDYTWHYGTGAYVASDTVNFNTGNSSKVVLSGTRSAYAQNQRYVPGFSFIKAATNPVSITFSARLIAGSYSLRLVEPTFAVEISVGGSGIAITNTTGWTDYTFTFTPQGTAFFNGYEQGSIVEIMFENGVNPTGAILIDKITLNY